MAFMPVYIEKSGDLVGCYHSGTDGQTNKERQSYSANGPWTAEMSNCFKTISNEICLADDNANNSDSSDIRIDHGDKLYLNTIKGPCTEITSVLKTRQAQDEGFSGHLCPCGTYPWNESEAQ